MMVVLISFSLACDRTKQDGDLLLDVDPQSIVEVIRQYEGEKPVLLNVWATWCAPCIEEFPYLLRLNQEYGDDFELLLVNADFEEAKPEAIEFLKKQSVDFRSYYKTGSDNEFILAVSEEWTGALPYTLILDKNGEIIAQWEGKADYQSFESGLLEAINN
jgi:thiol-disulfide isomerase/thioredoxin